MSSYYRRHLPHYQPAGATYFVTFRLAGPLPVKVLLQLLDEKRELEERIKHSQTAQKRAELWRLYYQKHFKCLDAFLEHNGSGPLWLAQPEIAQVVIDAIKFRDESNYDLYSYCIMPNHVHMVFRLLRNDDGNLDEFGGADFSGDDGIKKRCPVTDIIGSLKKHTAMESNKILLRSGPFWRSESYDRVVRDADELDRILWYVLLNPVKARLVKSWSDWKWTYCKRGLLNF